MRFLRRALARLRGSVQRDAPDADLRAELEAHLEMEIAENVRRGMPGDEARRQALLHAGGITQAAEAVRDQRRLPWLDGVAADLRYAVRALKHSRAFASVVVVTLALGIGANTAIFSVVRPVLLKPLPHRDGDRLLYLRQSSDGPAGANLAFSVPEVRDFRSGVPSLAGIAEYSSWTAILQGDEGAERIRVGLVTGNYFEVMGLAPVLGRLTGPGDDGKGAAPVAVLAHEFWMRRFGGDTSIVGRTVTLDKRPVAVIGVLQPAPFFPDRVDALLNLVNSEHHLSATMVEGRTHRMTEVVARLRRDATLEQARQEIASVYARMQREHPHAYDAGSHFRVAVFPFNNVLGERARLTLRLLIGAAAFVLVIAAANVANLTLMRGVRRRHELVVRAALGAGAARLGRLLLAENLLLALAGAALGTLVALGGVPLLAAFLERYSPRATEIRLDLVVLAFAAMLAIVVAVVLSWIAVLPREGRFAQWILSGAQRVSGAVHGLRLQRALVVVQVAVSVVLLVGAGLLTRTLMRLSDVRTGLRAQEVLTLSVPLLTPTELLTSPGADASAKERYEQMRREMAALPGVTAAGVGTPLPLRRSDVVFEVKAEGRTLRPGQAMPRAELRTADAHFFEAGGIPLVQGRAFAITDAAAAERVVVINDALARELFGDADPVGHRIAWTGETLKFTPLTEDWRTVVGVAANTRDGGVDAEPRPVVWMPFTQFLAIGGGFAIRADSNVADLVPAVSRIVRRYAPAAPIENVMTIAQYRARSVAPRRVNAALISSFGGLALLIAAVGIAGVLGFSVSARTTEIGIRMSLGADRGRVERMILGEGGVLLGVGVVLGVAGALSATRVIEGLLFGVAPHDPLTFAAVVLVMIGVGLVACWIPALRAARIDPAIAMRA